MSYVKGLLFLPTIVKSEAPTEDEINQPWQHLKWNIGGRWERGSHAGGGDTCIPMADTC